MPGEKDAPEKSWTEGTELLAENGKKLPRYGSVKVACKMLGECHPQEVYDLIQAGILSAYKLKPHRPNSHWRVDLLSVWNHRQAQLASQGN